MAFAAETVTYTYDALGRLVGANSAGGPVDGEQTQIGYDPAGNRSTYTVGIGAPGAVTLSIGNATAQEGNIASFTVTKTGTTTGTVTVNWAAAAGSASTGDFSASSGQLSFAPNETSKTVSVQTTEDTSDESNENFTVTLSSPSGATITTAIGTGTIEDDDDPPAAISFSVNDITVTEGNTLNFIISKSGSGAADVTYATANQSATAGSDYAGKTATVLQFNSGDTSKTISVTTTDDSLVEGTETFFFNLSNATNGATIGDTQGVGTITDNDTATLPTFSVTDPTANEGGTLVFTIVKNGAGTASVYYATANGTATAGSDYTAKSLTKLDFAYQQSSLTVSVSTATDSAVEGDETVLLNLSNPTDATIADTQGVGTIIDDDDPPPSNNPPVAANDTAALPRCTDGNANLVANDSDPDAGDTIALVSVTPISSPIYAEVEVQNSTSVSIYAGPTVGTTTYSYTIQDNHGATATGTLTVSTGAGLCNG